MQFVRLPFNENVWKLKYQRANEFRKLETTHYSVISVVWRLKTKTWLKYVQVFMFQARFQVHTTGFQSEKWNYKWKALTVTVSFWFPAIHQKVFVQRSLETKVCFWAPTLHLLLTLLCKDRPRINFYIIQIVSLLYMSCLRWWIKYYFLK